MYEFDVIERIFDNQNTTFTHTNDYSVPLAYFEKGKGEIKEMKENEAISVILFFITIQYIIRIRSKSSRRSIEEI